MLSDKLNEEAKRVLEKLSTMEPGSDEYDELMRNLTDLDRMKLAEEKSELDAGVEDLKLKKAEEEASKNFLQKVDPNTWVSAGVTIFSILSVLNFEKIGVITSKAFSFIHKPRLK